MIRQPPPSIPLIQQVNAGFQTGTDPAGSHTLTPTNTFSVTGLFNVAVPSAVSGAYQFYLGNNTRTPGREVRIRVLQTDSGPVLLFIWRDFVTGQNTIIDQVALTPAELAEPQLELEISHDVANSDVLTALYAFGSGNTLASFNGNLTELGRTDSTTDIFTSTKNFAQPGFEAFDPVPEPSSLAILAAAALCSLGVIRRYAKWRLCSGAAHAIGSKLTPRRRAAPAKSLSFVASGIPLRMASSR